MASCVAQSVPLRLVQSLADAERIERESHASGIRTDPIRGPAVGQRGERSGTDDTVDALDAVLDDIESVLETNAEEYVGSFVQKGGE